MGKRGAVGSGSPSKRSRGADAGTRAKISAVVAALLDDSLQAEATMGARTMLADGAPAALATVVEERHPLQDVIMGHIREVFGDIAARLQAKVVAATETTDAQSAIIAGQTSQLEAATAELEAAKTARDGESEKLTAAQETLRAAEVEASSVEASKKLNSKERVAVEKEKSKYTVIKEGLFEPLVEGGLHPTEKERQKAINKLVKDLERIGAESAMLVSVTPVLMKKADERKGFDTMVLDSVMGVLKKAIEGVDSKLAACDSKAAELDQDAAAKVEVVGKAKADADSQTAALEAAQAVQDQKASAKEAAASVVEASKQVLEEHNDSVSEAKSDVAAFAEVQESLAALAALSSAPVEPEAPAEGAPEAEGVAAP